MKKLVITSLAIASILGIGLVQGDNAAQNGFQPGVIEPEADAKLRAMSDYLAGLQALRVELDVDREVIDLAGQKLQYS